MSPKHDATLASSRVEDADLRSRLGFDRDDDRWLELARDATSEIPLGSLGRYRLLAEVGRGSQGAVYKAMQPGTGRAIAIKRLAAGAFAARQARARFEREIEAAAALSHPGVVTVLGTDECDGQTLLLMEWVDGEPLDRWAAGAAGPAPRPLDERLQAFVGICDAVAHAHSRGVIHRDLKPSNILVDPRGRPRVLDFGLAKVLGASWERPGAMASMGTSFVGTPAFAAPEQVAENADTIDTRADVYALGVLLYQLLTLRLPFDPSLPLAQLFDLVRQGTPARPSTINPEFGTELDCIVGMAMCKQRAQRYQTVEALCDDVRRYLRGEAVGAHPPGLWYHARKLIARHRVAFVALALALASLAALAIVSTLLAARLASQGDELAAALSSEQEQHRLADRHAADELAARSVAEQKGEVNRQASMFMGDMLTALGEAIARDELDPARGMIDDAIRRLDAREVRDPIVEMQLRRQVARLAFLAGSRDAGRASTMRAWELCQAYLPREHEETARCLAQLGYLAESDRDLASAERFDREAVAIFERTIGSERPETANAINNLGCVLNDLDRQGEALELHQRALVIRRRILGDVSPEVAVSLRNIGNALRTSKRFDEAEMYLQSALDVATRANADASAREWIRFNIGRLRVSQGRLDEALEFFRELLVNETRSRGEHTTIAGRLHTSIANALESQGHFEQAAVEHTLAYEAYTASMGRLHPYTLTAAFAEARLLEKAGLPQRAIPRYRIAFDLAREAGDVSLARSRAMALARCLRKDGREQDAVGVESELADFERRFPPTPPAAR